MREQCATRAAELTPEHWIGAWRDLLFSTLPALAEEVQESPLHRLPLALRAPLRGTGRWMRWRPAR